MRFWRRLPYRDANRNGLGTPKESYAPTSTCPDFFAPLCAQTATPLLVHANALTTFCILDTFVTIPRQNINCRTQASLSPTTFSLLFCMCTFLLFAPDLPITVTSFFLLRVAVNRPHAGVGGSPGRTGARWSRGRRWNDLYRRL